MVIKVPQSLKDQHTSTLGRYTVKKILNIPIDNKMKNKYNRVKNDLRPVL
jgi:hypothetical protein